MNIKAENALLGCILLDNNIIKELAVTDEHFFDFHNKQLFSAMLAISKKDQPINEITINEHLGEVGFSMIGGSSHIKLLKESVPTLNEYKLYEEFVINNWKERETKRILKDAIDNHRNIQDLISELNKIDQTGTKEVFNLQDHLIKMYELPETPVPKGLSGIPSGFTVLDLMTDGWQDEDSIIIGARPSMGKTAFMLNLAVNAGIKNAIPIIFSLEMSAESLIKRMLSAIGGIDGIKVRNPYNYFNDKDRENWIKAIGVLEKMNLQIFDKPRQTVSEMRGKIRQIKNSHPNKKTLVLIDYLTLIKPSKDYNGNTHAQVTEISQDLKSMAKEFKCPVITLAQLSRSVEQRQNKRPVMSDLRESGSIEQDADIIMFLYRDDYYNDNPENKNILEVDIAKQRNGPTGVIKLYYNKEINKISNLSKGQY
jgi:replicative DNA helicase